MKRNPVMLGLALTVVAFATAVSLGWLPMYPARADTTPAPAAVTAIANASRGTPLQSLLATPQARSYQQRQRFHNEARDFFRDASSLGPVERERRAQTLQRQIDGYEQARELSAGESLMLRIGLIQATVADPARQKAMVQQLAQRYRADAQRREQQWADRQQHDPRFQSYKQREQIVVAEVMAMQSIPSGLTRNEYLRQRLQAERERIYR
ncbi:MULTISPECIES: hypothetical protein [Lysobacter]|uniref:Lipase chaperone n=2 Tax=Lysobacter gummosus TaxID=262324 RepID=A0ABY3XHY6_9GAMM|nr:MULTISPECIES: hypothetical protein [Lysobacter]ALN90765.1 hypothetical protein LG3211_1791 [Lysobacter gummosus]UJB17484.1 hypothetical protein L1A79_13965 [Lysobacter capsici]UJQ28793.1 hypothetical protein L2D09_00900 [Lysobacter gummosus]UNP31235.1 hypothetical protein MOV92_08335 [Lysobacter gummosus]